MKTTLESESFEHELSEDSPEEEVNDDMTVLKSTFFGQSDLTRVFPSRNIFLFKNGVKIDSNFDGGNLMTCDLVSNESKTEVEFDAHVCPDGYPYMVFQSDDGREPGLFFSVSGISAADGIKNIKFNFRQLSHQAKLVQYGHKPVFLRVANQKYLNLVSGKSVFQEQNWQKVPQGLKFISPESRRGVYFDVPVPDDIEPSDHILISYTYPFTLNDVSYMLDKLQFKCDENDSIYFSRDTIGHSIENRAVEMITISSYTAQYTNKPVIFFTCRSHPGEAPG